MKQMLVSYEMQISGNTCDFWIQKESGERSYASLKLLLWHLPKQNNVIYENFNQVTELLAGIKAMINVLMGDEAESYLLVYIK